MISTRDATFALVLFCCTALAPAEALAYTGPGAGVTALGSLVALVSAILFAVVGFVWYPVKRLMKSLKKAPAPAVESNAK